MTFVVKKYNTSNWGIRARMDLRPTPPSPSPTPRCTWLAGSSLPPSLRGVRQFDWAAGMLRDLPFREAGVRVGGGKSDDAAGAEGYNLGTLTRSDIF